MREIYLDHAATTFPKPEEVYRAIETFMRTQGGSPGRGLYRKAVESEEMLSETRESIAALLGVADPTRIVLTSNSTEALNTALKGFVRPGDHVVSTVLEHNAVVRPLHSLHKTRDVELTTVESSPLGELDPEAVARAIRPGKTRLVVCVHGNNVLGSITPIAEITRRAHALGVPVLCDGSQTAGTLPLSVSELGVDLFAFTGHKGLLGAPGTGGLIVGPGIDLEPLKEGGTGSASESPDPPEWLPDRLEPGTPNTFGIAGLRAGVAWLRERGVAWVREHEAALSQRLLDRLRETRGVVVHSPADPARRLGVVSANFEHLSPTEACGILANKFGINVRCGLHCSPLTHRRIGTERTGTLRFSVGVFTTEADVDAAADAVKTISDTLYRRREARAS
jgi:cysteine desulfurase family protein